MSRRKWGQYSNAASAIREETHRASAVALTLAVQLSNQLSAPSEQANSPTAL